MFNADLLRLMHRIALGMPLVLPTLAAPFNYAGCYPLGYECPRDIVPAVVQYNSDGEGAIIDCAAACGGEGDEAPRCRAVDQTHVECLREVVMCPAAGRRPGGEIQRSATRADERDPTCAWLFDALALEASAVPAFDELASALEGLGAPVQLSARAREAREDELRHTEAMTRLLARRESEVSVRVRVNAAPAPTLYELALANAVEGCTREAFGALEAALQGARAAEPDLRAAMAEIAQDEARHALLSFDIDTWARARLSPADNRRLDAARSEAIAGLRQTLLRREAPAGLGLLTALEARALIRA